MSAPPKPVNELEWILDIVGRHFDGIDIDKDTYDVAKNFAVEFLAAINKLYISREAVLEARPANMTEDMADEWLKNHAQVLPNGAEMERLNVYFSRGYGYNQALEDWSNAMGLLNTPKLGGE